MLSSQMWSSVGLVCDIFGVVLLWIFGLPADIPEDGCKKLNIGGPDPALVAKRKLFDGWGRFGLLLIILGFGCQFLGTICSTATKQENVVVAAPHIESVTPDCPDDFLKAAGELSKLIRKNSESLMAVIPMTELESREEAIKAILKPIGNASSKLSNFQEIRFASGRAAAMYFSMTDLAKEILAKKLAGQPIAKELKILAEEIEKIVAYCDSIDMLIK